MERTTCLSVTKNRAIMAVVFRDSGLQIRQIAMPIGPAYRHTNKMQGARSLLRGTPPIGAGNMNGEAVDITSGRSSGTGEREEGSGAVYAL